MLCPKIDGTIPRKTNQTISLLLKENIDGEALQWANERLKKRFEDRKILMVISDGAPVDDSTLSTNANDYLEIDLKNTVSSIEKFSSIELLAIGIGHDVTRYYKRAVKITDVHDLGDAMINQLTDLFSNKKNIHKKNHADIFFSSGIVFFRRTLNGININKDIIIFTIKSPMAKLIHGISVL